MGKHNKKEPNVETVITKSGEKIKVFDDLAQFETYIKNETEDEEFDSVHCRVKYYPPFVLHEAHDDPEKIKETENSHSKKFVRHLHQHIEKHLLKDIKTSAGIPDLKFKDKSEHKLPDQITWKFNDKTEYHGKPFEIHISATCYGDSAIVDVDYMTLPIKSL
ncbi:uncharacterized protein SCDLUD_000340 [Saccharomycodes ludwigii]|uniref:uncharacterized protein n=1 Tax=Saccharomycodes ludwigii TaxID=36035 RepID=UPI001E849329|nr:hypothetical protein SCDLUD_000340 [Saccharomycodes ludwigii]KAH3902752.1 hypothetical protein SCDLUD_000340 [Saccharomycodes ludwigii]